MVKFHCSGCNYEFELERPPKNCPYCGRTGTIRRERTAGELLNEVDAMLKEG